MKFSFRLNGNRDELYPGDEEGYQKHDDGYEKSDKWKKVSML